MRLSALGDVTHVVPVVRAIQQQWPDTEITWVCGVLEKKLLTEISGVRFIVFDKKQGWRAYLDLKKALRHEVFDVLLHMQVAARANIASLFIKSRVRLGWDKNRSRDFHHLFINQQVPAVKFQHQLEGFLSFATTLGLKVSQPVWDFPLSADAMAFADQHIPGSGKTLLISPCSSHSLRNWNIEGYARVADYAIEQLGMQVVLSGGPSSAELEMAEAIEGAMQHPAINLVGKDTLQQLMAMLKKVDVVISPDSGPAHMANAMGTPVIGLHACTWSRRSGPYNSLDICVDKFETAAKIYTEKTAQELRWGTKIEQPGVMDLIRPEDVIARLTAVIKNA
ncbi:MAG: glycosyltransferase family 9 protein [Gammaproteobacteria bacterium]|nr:glycosyltransferase family 9 protein [Gammaproteobacteria bacterium]